MSRAALERIYDYTCISNLYYVVYTFLQTFSTLEGKLFSKYAKSESLVYPEQKILSFCGLATKPFLLLVLGVDSHTLILCCESLKLLEIKHVAYSRLYI